MLSESYRSALTKTLRNVTKVFLFWSPFIISILLGTQNIFPRRSTHILSFRKSYLPWELHRLLLDHFELIFVPFIVRVTRQNFPSGVFVLIQFTILQFEAESSYRCRVRGRTPSMQEKIQTKLFIQYSVQNIICFKFQRKSPTLNFWVRPPISGPESG